MQSRDHEEGSSMQSEKQSGHIAAFLNTGSGTFQMLEIGHVRGMLERAFGDAGYELTIYTGGGADLISQMKEHSQSDDFDILLAGGGDGTVSAAAETAWRNNKTLAVLPGGTMNLYARALSIPLDVELAIDALSSGKKKDADIATANGDPFVHQFSVGLHPRMIRKRNNLDYQSRITKMLASTRAFWETISHMPTCGVTIDLDGKREERQLSALSVSNNLFGSTAPPYAERLDGGELGVYMAGQLTWQRALILGTDLLIGQTPNNPDLEIHSAKCVKLTVHEKPEGSQCVRDGELYDLPDEITIELHAKELSVLVP
nr:diacylglycerol kinase family protein [uncultured Cohaesibacter sp.]